MSGIFLKVTPEVLQSKSRQITSTLGSVERELRAIETEVTSSKNYWEGDASNQHQKKYRELKEQADTLMARLKKHPENLLQMAGLYQSTESEATETSTSLPDDLL